MFNRFLRFLSVGMLVTIAASAGDVTINKQTDGFNIALLAGGGFHWFVSDRTAVTAGMRYEHISNAGLHGKNHGVDTAQVLLGLTFFPR